MSLPHDYYDPERPPHGPHGPHDDERPDLHNRGESWPYLDPDYFANYHDDQLPLISTVGRGPRGEGLTVGSTVDEDGNVSFTLVSTLTGETVWESPNLAPAEISFGGDATDWTKLVPGVHAPLDITVKRGDTTKTTTVYLPAGQRGSLVYLLDKKTARRADDTYVTTIGDLTIYGKQIYQDKPTPRPNDVVFYPYTDGDEYGFAFGTIENVGGYKRENEGEPLVISSDQVVFTSRVYVPMSGLPATIDDFDFIELAKGAEAYATLEKISDIGNSYRMTLALPKVEDGKSIVIVNDMNSVPDVPTFMENFWPNYGQMDENSAVLVKDTDANEYYLMVRGPVTDPNTAPAWGNPWKRLPYGLMDSVPLPDILTDTELGGADSGDSTDMYHLLIPSEHATS